MGPTTPFPTQEFLTSLAPPYETWIGLHDRSTEGSFQWVDGSALSFRWEGSRGHGVTGSWGSPGVMGGHGGLRVIGCWGGGRAHRGFGVGVCGVMGCYGVLMGSMGYGASMGSKGL